MAKRLKTKLKDNQQENVLSLLEKVQRQNRALKKIADFLKSEEDNQNENKKQKS